VQNLRHAMSHLDRDVRLADMLKAGAALSGIAVGLEGVIEEILDNLVTEAQVLHEEVAVGKSILLAVGRYRKGLHR
jgi:hypothetical protein